MLKLPNLELLEYKAKQALFSNEENRKLYKKKAKGSPCKMEVRVFPQTWGNTCLGFDVDKNGNAMAGGNVITEAYTTVFYEPVTETYIVFFGSETCYMVNDATEKFFSDLRSHRLEPLSIALRLY